MARAPQLTTKDLQKGFGVGHMTVYNWRAGTAKRDPLPSHLDETTGRRFFKPAEVKAWAKKYDLPFTMPENAGELGTPGPKAAAKEVTEKKPVKKAGAKKAGAKKASSATKAKFARVARKVEKQATPPKTEITSQAAAAT